MLWNILIIHICIYLLIKLHITIIIVEIDFYRNDGIMANNVRFFTSASFITDIIPTGQQRGNERGANPNCSGS